MTAVLPTDVPGLPLTADDRAHRALRLVVLRANQPANEGVDRAICKAAGRALVGIDHTYSIASQTSTKDVA